MNLFKMSQDEINEIPKERFFKISEFHKNGCFGCGFVVEALSLWCSNSEASKLRGTRQLSRYSSVIKCPFWKPNPDLFKMNNGINIAKVVYPDGREYFNPYPKQK